MELYFVKLHSRVGNPRYSILGQVKLVSSDTVMGVFGLRRSQLLTCSAVSASSRPSFLHGDLPIQGVFFFPPLAIV